MPTIVKEELKGKTIGTMNGDATYLQTEIEDENGRWDDHWLMSNGEFVIHDGREHHVYVV